jgi:hypothetical protein
MESLSAAELKFHLLSKLGKLLPAGCIGARSRGLEKDFGGKTELSGSCSLLPDY